MKRISASFLRADKSQFDFLLSLTEPDWGAGAKWAIAQGPLMNRGLKKKKKISDCHFFFFYKNYGTIFENLINKNYNIEKQLNIFIEYLSK